MRPSEPRLAPELERQFAHVQQQDHVCVIYQELGETMAAAGAFLRAGLERGERCLYITGEHSTERVTALLAAEGIRVDRERERGALEFRPTWQRSRAQRFEPARIVGRLRQVAEQALASGYSGLRVVSDVTWSLREGANPEQLGGLETQYNELLATAPITMLCQYAEARFSAEAIASVLHLHPQVSLDGQLSLNPYYEPPAVADEPSDQALPAVWKLLHLRRLALVEAEYAQLTREQAAQEAAEQAHRRLTRLLERMGDAFVAFDAEWRCVYVNAEAERLLGRSRQELLGRNVWEALPEHADSMVADKLRRAMAERRPLVGEGFSADLDRWLAVRAYPAEDGLTLHLHDVTERKRSDAEKARLAAIAASSDAAILGMSAEGLITAWNPAAERLYGYSAEEAVGRSNAMLVPADRLEEFAELLDRLRRGEPISNYETVRVRKDGTRVEVSLNLSPIKDAAGTPVGVSVVARDITERKRMEQALRESEARYRRLAEHAEDVIYRYELTPRRGFSYVNSAVTRVVGYTPEEHYADPDLGRTYIHPDDLRQLGAAEDDGQPPRAVEQRWRHRDGRLIWIEQRNVPIFDAKGELVAIEGISRDITERKRVEQAQRFLAQASAELVTSLDYAETLQRVARLAVPEMADWCVVDLLEEDGAIHLAAVAHVEPAKEAIIRELRERYPFDPRSPHGLPKVLRTGEAELYPEVQEAWRQAAAQDGEHLRLMQLLGAQSSLCVPLVARGRVLGALTFMSAESGRRYAELELALAQKLAQSCALALDNARLYERLQQTIRLREDLVASVTHDLRNPLTAILGYAHLLQRQTGRSGAGEGLLHEAVAKIDQNARHMNALLNEMLDIARLEAGQKLQLQPTPTDLVALARHQAKLHERVRVEAEVAEVVGHWDTARLERVLENLLANALKYSPEERRVVLGVAREDTWAVLRVRDQGVGIPAGDLPRVFERFHRARNVQGRVAGTGLGLWGAREIVRAHGGRLHVESSEGLGTTVTVRLPLEPGPPVPDEPDAAAPPGLAGVEKLTPRQREVAALLARGCSNKQLAKELGLTPGTAANHVEHILNRLGLQNRAQVAVWAARQGLTPPGERGADPGE